MRISDWSSDVCSSDLQQLQRSGKWRHIWRVVGEYANYSIFDVDSNEELHEILTGLPLFPYMRIAVTPLCRHPSSVRDGDACATDIQQPQRGTRKSIKIFETPEAPGFMQHVTGLNRTQSHPP